MRAIRWKSVTWRGRSIRAWSARSMLTMRRRAVNSRGFAQADPVCGTVVIPSPVPSRRREGEAMHKDEENALRKKIEQVLGAGLHTQTEPFPETEKEFTQLLAELRALPAA